MTKDGDNLNGTRKRILDAALAVFMEKGYEGATVRMILQASGTVASSFYHFFDSKESLFEAVIEMYLKDYTKRVETIAENSTMSAPERLEAVLAEIARSTDEYFGKLKGNKLHWTVQYALHEKTILEILPSVQHMIERLIEKGTVKSRLNVDAQTLSAALVKGTEGILHARSMESLNKQQLAELLANVREYICLILEV